MMMNPSAVAVLHAVCSMHGVSGYCPSVGEVGKVAGVTYGVAFRALEKLVSLQYIECHTSVGSRVAYRFSSNAFGKQILLSKGKS